MIHRLNEQVLDSSDSDVHTERKQGTSQWRGGSNKNTAQIPAQSDRESPATSSLRTLVEENEKANPAQVIATTKRQRSEGGVVSEEQNEDCDDDSEDGCRDQKRSDPPNTTTLMAQSSSPTSDPVSKRPRQL
jgi:hypothetical protein